MQPEGGSYHETMEKLDPQADFAAGRGDDCALHILQRQLTLMARRNTRVQHTQMPPSMSRKEAFVLIKAPFLRAAAHALTAFATWLHCIIVKFADK